MGAYKGWESQKDQYRWTYRHDPENRSIIERKKMERLEESECGFLPFRQFGKGFCIFLVVLLTASILNGEFTELFSEFLAGFSSRKLLVGIIIGLVAFFLSYIRKRDAQEIEEMEARNSQELPQDNSRTFRAY